MVCGPKLFRDLKLLQVWTLQIHTFSHYNSNFYKLKKRLKRRLFGLFCNRVVQCFVEICGFAICGLAIAEWAQESVDSNSRTYSKQICLPSCGIFTFFLPCLKSTYKKRAAWQLYTWKKKLEGQWVYCGSMYTSYWHLLYSKNNEAALNIMNIIRIWSVDPYQQRNSSLQIFFVYVFFKIIILTG